MEDTPAQDVLRTTRYENLRPLPADASLADVNVAMADPTGRLGLGREARLKRALENLDREYDFVIVDTGPQPTLLNINVLIYVHDVCIPIDPG
jgi:chromosome partitioning protein